MAGAWQVLQWSPVPPLLLWFPYFGISPYILACFCSTGHSLPYTALVLALDPSLPPPNFHPGALSQPQQPTEEGKKGREKERSEGACGEYLHTLHVWSHVTLMSMLGGRHCCYPHIIDEETEAQRGSITCPSPIAVAVLFIYLAAPVLSCGVWNPVPRPGIKPGPPALGAWSPGSWTTREVPPHKLLSGRARIQSQAVWLQSPHLWGDALSARSLLVMYWHLLYTQLPPPSGLEPMRRLNRLASRQRVGFDRASPLQGGRAPEQRTALGGATGLCFEVGDAGPAPLWSPRPAPLSGPERASGQESRGSD